jgi:hypothetical protein
MERCQPSCPPHTTLFCPTCKQAKPEDLSSVRLMGFVGVKNSTNPKIERFWKTGDPTGL